MRLKTSTVHGVIGVTDERLSCHVVRLSDDRGSLVSFDCLNFLN